jgi:D-alanyl-D-alanine carboxypeptidase
MRQTGSDPFWRVDALAARLIAAGATPGAAVAVTDREPTRWVGVYGHADAAAGRPVTEATLFQIGSISKSFTAVCLLREWERGRLDLDADVRTLLPWFPLEGITVHHLLSHTGGIVCSLGDPPSPGYEVLALARTARAPAGERFWYSNVGYQALGLVLERLTGEPFADTYRREILEPLRMDATDPLTTPATRPALAVGHQSLEDAAPWRLGDPLAPAPFVEYRGADGSVCAPAGDLAAYARMFLTGGVPARMMVPVAEDPEEGPYGYGVVMRTVAGRRWVGHAGGTVGFVARLWCDLDAGLAAVSMVNGPAGAGILAEHALRIAAGDDVPDPTLDDLADPAAAAVLDAEPGPEFAPLCGLYRSHNPWATSLRVATSAGRPVAIAWGECRPLVPLEGGSFRLGDEPWSPERVRFDTLLEGRYLRAWHGATPFHRPF